MDIIWIPAGDQDGSVYHDQVEALQNQYRCTCIDPRGAGNPQSKVDPPWSIEQLAGDIAEVIQQVCQPPLVVTGLSYGALMVQELAITTSTWKKIAELAGNENFHLLKGMGHFSIFGHKPKTVTDCIKNILENY